MQRFVIDICQHSFWLVADRALEIGECLLVHTFVTALSAAKRTHKAIASGPGRQGGSERYMDRFELLGIRACLHTVFGAGFTIT